MDKNENPFTELMEDLAKEIGDAALENFKEITISRVRMVGEVAAEARSAGLSEEVTNVISADLWTALLRGPDN
ncbi:hypothetical protein [Streptomyces sp. NPDC055036]